MKQTQNPKPLLQQKIIKKEPKQRMEKFGARLETIFTEIRPCRFAIHRTGAQYTSAPTIAGRRDIMQGHVGREQTLTEQRENLLKKK